MTEEPRSPEGTANSEPLAGVIHSDMPDKASEFRGLLSPHSSSDSRLPPADRSFASDINLDQIVSEIAAEQEEHELITALLYGRTLDPKLPLLRQEVFRDLEAPELLAAMRSFAKQMLHVRRILSNLDKMAYKHQQTGAFVDAATTYCALIVALDSALSSCDIKAMALRSFHEYLRSYLSSPFFRRLEADTREQRRNLDSITYALRIGGSRVEVRRYKGESNYNAILDEIFSRFQQEDGVKNYQIQYRTWPGMNHIGGQIADRVAKLFPNQFSRLDEFCSLYSDFVDTQVRRFEREIQFFLAYIAFIEPLRAQGLSFCYPEIATASKAIFANDAFDLALAHKLSKTDTPIVRNDFSLSGGERVIVVSGPNQGGKTTFARMFGQLHQLASAGCPVPGRSARLVLFDQMFSHFEKVEDLGNLRGKLEDDLVRVQEMLGRATSQSIVILNEVFTSTTLKDSRFLGRKAMQKIIDLDVLCVYVTFVEELASFAPSVVSMVSTVVPGNPAERTFKVVRAPADGLAYAMAIAERYGMTYPRLRERLAS